MFSISLSPPAIRRLLETVMVVGMHRRPLTSRRLERIKEFAERLGIGQLELSSLFRSKKFCRGADLQERRAMYLAVRTILEIDILDDERAALDTLVKSLQIEDIREEYDAHILSADDPLAGLLADDFGAGLASASSAAIPAISLPPGGTMSKLFVPAYEAPERRSASNDQLADGVDEEAESLLDLGFDNEILPPFNSAASKLSGVLAVSDLIDDEEDWLGVSEALDLEDTALRDRFALEATLRQLTNKIHSSTLDEILLFLGDELKELFDTKRVTIWVLDKVKKELFSKERSGGAVVEARVPVGTGSLAGYVALSGRELNVANAYDAEELSSVNHELQHDQAWDQERDFVSRQMLLIPVKASRRVQGVIELRNRDEETSFTGRHERTLKEVAETLSIAFANKTQPSVGRSRFSYLIQNEVITEEVLAEAKTAAPKEGLSVESYLVEKLSIPKGEVVNSLSEFFRVQGFMHSAELIPPLGLLPEFSRDFLISHTCVPLGEENNRVTMGFANPRDIMLRDDLVRRLDREIDIKVAVREDILAIIDDFYPEVQESDPDVPSSNELTALIGTIDIGGMVEEAKDEEVKEDDTGIVRLVNQIIEHAYRRDVSDIHIEPYPEKDLVVRFRIDGVCREYTKVPRRFARAMLSRLKIMGGLNISERRLPQDGKIKFKKYSPLDIELRLATMPTVGGLEDAVMRILAASKPMPLDQMGFSPENLVGFKDAVAQPYGLVLVVGPTGSGKTTTLHSALGFINKPETKIWTAEDPVEITQDGLRQVQTHAKIGFTFARALRGFLRCDPDVIMIGEMRDAETAEAGIEASLTGHVVFSTLHTNSAPETVTRLLDMGLDPFSFGDSLLGVLAQRLCRRLCRACKQQYEPAQDELDAIRGEFGNDECWERLKLEDEVELYQAMGCAKCDDSGYRGRMGIHEFMPGSDDLRQVIYGHGKVAELRAQAVKEGMTTLKQDGIRKVLTGMTDLREIRRVCIK